MSGSGRPGGRRSAARPTRRDGSDHQVEAGRRVDERDPLGEPRERGLDQRAQLLRLPPSAGEQSRTELKRRGPSAAPVPPSDDLSWALAASVPQLGELAARWLTGTLSDHPSSLNGPDQGADPLTPLLAAVNRAGLFTDFCQPGLPDVGDGWLQRAVVTGYCGEATHRRLTAALHPTDLILLTDHLTSSTSIPVTLADGVPHTSVGGGPDTDIWVGELSKAGVAALNSSWHVCVIDPVWGRNDGLWPVLTEALDLPAELAAAASRSGR